MAVGMAYTGAGKETHLPSSSDEPASWDAGEEGEEGEEGGEGEEEGVGEVGKEGTMVDEAGLGIADNLICSLRSEFSRSLMDGRCGRCGDNAGPSSWLDWRTDPTAVWEPPMNGEPD